MSAPILNDKASFAKLALLAVAALFAAAAPARADITLAPLRAVLDEKTREARFRLSNPSGRIIEGRAGWIDLAATPEGYGEIEPEARADLSAAPFLVLSPAHFRLEPGAAVDIVVSLREDAAIPDGERRSHLLIETAAARTLLRRTSQEGLQVDIRAGVSAPVILRGRGRAAAAIGETRLLRDDDGLLALTAAIAPRGDHSAYGAVAADFRPEGARSTEPLGLLRNIAAYPDAVRRDVELPLGHVSLGAGELTLRFIGEGEFEGRVFDERRFDIAPPEG